MSTMITFHALVPTEGPGSTGRFEYTEVYYAEGCDVDYVRRAESNRHIWLGCPQCDWPVQDEDGPEVVGTRCTCAEDAWWDETGLPPEDTPSLDVAGFWFQAGF